MNDANDNVRYQQQCGMLAITNANNDERCHLQHTISATINDAINKCAMPATMNDGSNNAVCQQQYVMPATTHDRNKDDDINNERCHQKWAMSATTNDGSDHNP